MPGSGGAQAHPARLKLTPDSLARQLAQQLLPVYLISGDEPLLAGEAADAVRARARQLQFTEREVHFIERGTDWDAIRGAVASLSLFAARRLVELRLPSGKAGVGGGRALTRIIESLGDDVLLLILTGRLDRDAQSADWVSAAERRGAWVSVWPVQAERLPAWLEERCRRLGFTAEPQALQLLAERTQGNLLAAQQELEKLKLLDEGSHLDVARVLAGTSSSARFDVNELTGALLAEDAAGALRVLSGLRAEGVELPLVLWAVVRALRERAAGAPRPAWGMRHAPRSARAGPRLSQRALIARAARADAMAKGRAFGDAWDELALLAAELCGRPALASPVAPELA
ncbi:MAG TPA: DNA polymerase III subunit delta [Steroidobacteraceae bacterium]|nr:DNA polymerase III subunit delta [Steroidobacteraceae bacterium]